MKSHLIVPLFVLVAVSGLLIWRAGDEEQLVKRSPTTIAALALPVAPVRLARSEPPVAPAQPVAPTQSAWPNTEVVNKLRGVQSGVTADKPAAWRAAIAEALPVLATDQDVQLLVGDLLSSAGDPVDGLAWELLACMHCTRGATSGTSVWRKVRAIPT